MVILLADSHAERRQALKRLLDQDPDLSVAGEAAKAEDLLTQMQKTTLDLVLLDWMLPGLRDAELMAAIHGAECPAKVVAFGDTVEARREALAAGADAYVDSDDPVEWLLRTLHRVAGLSPCYVG